VIAGVGDVQITLHPAEDRFEVRAARVHLKLAVFFATDASTLSTAGRARLARLATALSTAPGRWTLVLRGHADHRGTDAYNLALSQRRAEAVKRLLSERRVEVDVSIIAEGEERASSLDEDNALRAARRVDVDVVELRP
jgi:peptidoglycan-associated lipoprotein